METFLRSILLGKEKGGAVLLFCPFRMWSGALIGDGAGRRETGRGLGEFFGAVEASRLAYPCFQK